METMTERLEIRVDHRTMRLLREEARERHTSVAQVVRTAISRLLEEDPGARLRAAEALFGIDAPVADWEQMEREIVAGHLSES